jgi:type IV secretion system protein TrbL
MPCTTVSPAAVFKVIFFIAGQCFDFANSREDKNFNIFPEFSRILIGLICAFAVIITGVFALLEYLICFLEFLLVASVGVILFPLSIWEGSKFMSEKFIGAIVGFFIKLLFCNLAIMLLIYGFVSLFYIFQNTGFTGKTDQIVFIIFICLFFFYICKSAPGIAQSLLTGTPSLSAAGAVSAVGGAIAAAGATMHIAKSAGVSVAGGVAKGGVGMLGSFAEADSASNAVKAAGGGRLHQAGAFLSSLKSDAVDSFNAGALGLTRSLLSGKGGSSSGGSGGEVNPHSWRDSFLNDQGKYGSQTLSEHLEARESEGVTRANNYITKHKINNNQTNNNAS